jgi:hypothetical protein
MRHDRDAPPLPPEMRYLWNMFIQVSRHRPINGANFLALNWSDIESWSRLYGMALKPWELDAITMLDDVWLAVMRKKEISVADLEEERDADG